MQQIWLLSFALEDHLRSTVTSTHGHLLANCLYAGGIKDQLDYGGGFIFLLYLADHLGGGPAIRNLVQDSSTGALESRILLGIQ